ncbi:hypothetical protein B0H14DRAFT_3852149 [Mycena olivaceomarginata]|nr:hypothetical protein B0H14DRAFT_3852149 [Mycena olivaceomarginata]
MLPNEVGKSLIPRNGALLDLPLDIFLEILKIVHPLDLLHLSRTSKTLRAFLLNRNRAEFIWRASFELIEDSPPKCPPYASQVSWIRLLVEEVCHACCAGLEHDYSSNPIWWEFGARFCDKCCVTQFVQRLPQELTGSYTKKPGRTAARWVGVFPCVSGCYLAKDIDLFMEKYTVSDNLRRAALIQDRRNRTTELTDYARICRPWMERIVKARIDKRKELKGARRAAIQTKFHEAGWPPSLTNSQDWHKHHLVNNIRPLTDREWNKIGPRLIDHFKDRMKNTVMSNRFRALAQAFPTANLDKLTQHLAFAPRIVDIALLPDVRAVLEGDLKVEITVEDLKAALESKLPDLLAACAADPFEYALAYFVCEKKCCKGHFTGKRNPCRAPRGWHVWQSESSSYEDWAAMSFSCNPFTVKDMFRLEPGFTVLSDVIKCYGKDPKTATCAEMDAAPGKLACMRCVMTRNQPKGWRDAVEHSLMFHSSLKPWWKVEVEN